MRSARAVVLATALRATRGDAGFPYASLVTVAWDVDGSPVFLFSSLADHTRNLAKDSRASLLVEAALALPRPETGPRISLLGRITRSDDERHRRRYLARHPDAAAYAGFGDFAVYRMQLERARYVGGFASAKWLDGADLLAPKGAAAAIAACETDVIAHMNADHGEALDLYANVLLGRGGKGWRMIALDPEGLDLARRGRWARLSFPSSVATAMDCRNTLIALAKKARAAPAKTSRARRN
ncbi:MAG: DUF2470 domain-containing protein [Rhodospirillales bacterium]|nr:DUF2470 domain-containing protein [Rhodospirillales bacterium]